MGKSSAPFQRWTMIQSALVPFCSFYRQWYDCHQVSCLGEGNGGVGLWIMDFIKQSYLPLYFNRSHLPWRLTALFFGLPVAPNKQ